MVIAYCISGHIREFNNQISNATNLAKDRGYNIYISTWTNKGISETPFWGGGVEFEDPIDIDKINNLYSPKILDIENSADYDYSKKYNFKLTSGALVYNVLSMFRKIKKSFSIIDIKPDVIIRSRFDVKDLVLRENLNCERGKIYGKLSTNSGLPSDVFFYGQYDTIMKCIPEESFFTDDIFSKALDAEDIFKKYMESKNLQFVIDDELFYSLKRMKF